MDPSDSASIQNPVSASASAMLPMFRQVHPDDVGEMILTESKSRYTLFPIVHNDIYQMYQNALASFWTASEIDFAQDLEHLTMLTTGEKDFIMHVLAFFSSVDGVVNENLCARFLNEVSVSEAKAFYATQICIEAIHNETYSLLIDTYEKDPIQRDRLFNAVLHFPTIAAKQDWAKKWIDDSSSSFAQRLTAFAIVEGLMFSGAFCAIFYMRERKLLPGLCFANHLISRDEGLHTEFACLLYSKMEKRLPESLVRSMIEEALEIEKEFICDALRVDIIGMNANLMKQYLEFVANRLYKLLGYGPDDLYTSKNPFSFMEWSAGHVIESFFEVRVANYSKAGVGSKSGIPSEFKIDLNADDF